jgi:hypothetical protein
MCPLTHLTCPFRLHDNYRNVPDTPKACLNLRNSESRGPRGLHTISVEKAYVSVV